MINKRPEPVKRKHWLAGTSDKRSAGAKKLVVTMKRSHNQHTEAVPEAAEALPHAGSQTLSFLRIAQVVLVFQPWRRKGHGSIMENNRVVLYGTVSSQERLLVKLSLRSG